MDQRLDLGTLSRTYDDWNVGDRYEIVKEIGVGSYGSVVQAIDRTTNNKVAIKKVAQVFDDLIDGKRILREVALLRRLKHETIVNIIEILQPKNPNTFNEIYVVLEYAQSDLKKLFKSSYHLEMQHINTLCYGVVLGLKYIHSAGVLHRDLKPANVLINQDCSVKVCDFGLARSVDWLNPKDQAQKDSKPSEDIDDILGSLPKSEKLKKKRKMMGRGKKGQGGAIKKKDLTSHVVTRWYRAPELILIEKDYDSKIDVWSLGCIYAELLGMIKEHAPTHFDRGPLFQGTSCFPLSPDSNARVKKSGFPVTTQDQLNMIFKVLGTPKDKDVEFVTDDKAIEYLKSFPFHESQSFSDIFPAAPQESIDFLEKTLRLDPSKRISIDECFEHPLFNDVTRDPELENFTVKQLTFDFENEEIDTEERLRELFLEEIVRYK